MRFQQTAGPVMAKGVEDTAFYRWSRLVALNEVGGDPDRFAVSRRPSSTSRCARLAGRLARHDDHAVHARHQARRRTSAPGWPCSPRCPSEWAESLASLAVTARRERRVDPDTEHLMWQTLVGAWPLGRRAAAAST